MQRIAHIEDGFIVNVSLADDSYAPAGNQLLESEALQQGLIWKSSVVIRRWDTPQDFLAEFTMPEKAAIELSTDMTIAALRFELSAWQSSVRADDPRVTAGVTRLVELGVLTTERQQQILGSTP